MNKKYHKGTRKRISSRKTKKLTKKQINKILEKLEDCDIMLVDKDVLGSVDLTKAEVLHDYAYEKLEEIE